MKSTTSITLDPEVFKVAQCMNLNVSHIAEQALRSHIGIKKSDVTHLDIELERTKERELSGIVVTKTAELNACRERIKAYEELQAKALQENLEMEKERIKKEVRCNRPGCTKSLLASEKGKFTHPTYGPVCKQCFFDYFPIQKT